MSATCRSWIGRFSVAIKSASFVSTNLIVRYRTGCGHMRDAFAVTMAQAGHHFLVAEVEGEPIGYVWMQEVTSASNAFKNATRTLYVRQISINPSHQRFGYGRQMMGYVEKWARAHDFPTIELDYWVANEDAARFYDELGFIAKRQVVVKSVETKENEKWRP
ncbi:GNAT family N-acetyltransferase [Bacillus subtilis]